MERGGGGRSIGVFRGEGMGCGKDGRGCEGGKELDEVTKTSLY